MKTNKLLIILMLVFAIAIFGCAQQTSPTDTDQTNDQTGVEDHDTGSQGDVCPAVCVPMYSSPECTFIECGSGCGADNVNTFTDLERCKAALGINDEESEPDVETEVPEFVPEEEPLILGEGKCEKTKDCKPQEICQAGKCVNTDELVKIEYKCIDVLNTSNGEGRKIRSILLNIDQGKPGKMEWYAQFYLYTTVLDKEYNVRVGTNPDVNFVYGYSGEKYLYPDMKEFPADGLDRTLRIEWYNNDRVLTRTVTMPVPNKPNSCD